MSTLVLDTSVFVKYKRRKTRPNVQRVLQRYGNSKIFASDMTYFEFLRNCQNKHEIRESLAILNHYARLSVDTNMIRFATYYYNVLTKFTKSDGKRAIATNQLSDSDVIIGAAAIRIGAMICTTDRNDFPAPFFTEISHEHIDTSQKIFVLQADTALFDQVFARIFD